MRIGLVCPYDLSKPGGVQAQVTGLAGALTRSGEDVSVIGPGLPDGMAGVDLGGTISVPGNRSKVPISLDPRVARAVREAADDRDVLHVHEPFMPLVSLAALGAGRPVVATFHAAPGLFGTGFYMVLRSQIRRLLGPNLRKVTAVSATAAAPMPDDLGVVIVPNGVDVAMFDLDVDRNPHRVTFLGRDEKRKGLDVLLEAWKRVSGSVEDAELVVMGVDRDTSGVTWMGQVDETAKAKILCSSGIFVAPNLGGESFGIVLVEGMAAGAAVVASDLDSFRDVGDDAVRYFTTGGADALAGLLIDLLGDGTTVEAISRAGRERARRFDWENVAADYLALYIEAVS